MKSHEFCIIASGLDPEQQGFEDRFFEAGCDDATISYQGGVIILAFAREAKTFLAALVSAVADVRKAGAQIERIEPDDLVSMAEIAKRAGVTRAAVSNYYAGVRGKTFPAPVAKITSDSPLWDWLAVSRWLFRKSMVPRNVVVRAAIIKNVNAFLVQSTRGNTKQVSRLFR